MSTSYLEHDGFIKQAHSSISNNCEKKESSLSNNKSEKNFKASIQSNTANSSNSNNEIRRRKDPKNMTTEELEDYINRNRSESQNKSMNSSFQSNNNYSFVASIGAANSNVNTNKNANSHQNNKNNKNFDKFASSSPSHHVNNEMSIKNSGLNYNYMNVNNPFLNLNNCNNYTKSSYNYQIENPNLITNTSNVSIDPMSDSDEKYLKFKSKVLPPSSHNIGRDSSVGNINPNTNPSCMCNSNSNFKNLQERNNYLERENEDLVKNFIQVGDVLEKERTEFQKKLVSEIHKAHEIEKSLKNEIYAIENENKHLRNEVNELQVKSSLMSTNINILENEKGRHLEQNAVDKSNLKDKMSNIMQENEENKKKIISANNENNSLRDKLSKVIEIVLQLE